MEFVAAYIRNVELLPAYILEHLSLQSALLACHPLQGPALDFQGIPLNAKRYTLSRQHCGIASRELKADLSFEALFWPIDGRPSDR